MKNSVLFFFSHLLSLQIFCMQLFKKPQNQKKEKNQNQTLRTSENPNQP